MAVGDEDLQAEDHDGDDDEERRGGKRGGEQANGGNHRAEVGADIDSVGGEEQQYGAKENVAVVVAAHDARQPLARDEADAGAHLLGGDHQRKEVEGGPEEAEAVGGSSLGVRADARGVVIGGSGNQAGADNAQGAGRVRHKTRAATVRAPSGSGGRGRRISRRIRRIGGHSDGLRRLRGYGGGAARGGRAAVGVSSRHGWLLTVVCGAPHTGRGDVPHVPHVSRETT